MRRCLYILFVLFSLPAFSQLSTLKYRQILPHQGDTIQFDSGFVVSGSLNIRGYTSDQDFVQLANYLVWKAVDPLDTITIQYKRLFFPISYKKKDIKIIQHTFEQNPFKYVPTRSKQLVDYGSLKTAGNVSRGIGFGNAQDVVVNSNLNLRLSGKLANDVELLAVISDENNPIQPEGNTQQIQDFDQVYIILKKDSSKLTLGDFLMKRPSDSYFINYYKKSRGIQYENVKRKKGWRIETQAEAALSRGRFSRNRIEGIEGNSGPYRLKGENGELFIVVIAGTENVFLDGKKLTRGEDNDYVINYNTGEITFTPRILITRYSRIVVEFQYSDRNYGRSVTHAGASLSKGKFTVYVNGFNEMDLKSQPFQQSLDGFDSLENKSALQILSEAGDSLAFFSNVRPQVGYNSSRIMYTKQIVLGEEVFVYASDPLENTTFYEVIFSNLGFGNGSYQQAQSAANGKVFEYVGQGSGDYAPIEILIAPKKLNALNFGIKLEQQGRKTGIEYAISSLDENSLSSVDDGDNRGFGLRIYRTTHKKIRDSSQWEFISDVNYEIVSGNYNYVERYRTVEFDRKWNKVLNNPTSLSQFIPAYEHIANVSFGLNKNASTYLNNNSSYFLRPGNFSGFSNNTKGGFSWRKISFNSTLELMQSSTVQGDSSNLRNDFYNITAEIRRPIWKLVTGLGYQSEFSSFKNDTLKPQSYGFKTYHAFLQSNDSSRLKYNLTARQRHDERPKNEGFAVSTIGSDVTLQSEFTFKKSQRIELNTIYRQLSIKDTLLSSKELEQTLQSRIELDLHFFKKFIRSRTFYQIGTGQEQRREFQYLEVQAGNGVYIWNDYDSNSLKTLNEFEVASELDRQRADYIKIYTPVAGFITTNSNKISQTIELNPAVFYKQKQKKKAFIARFNSLSTLILDKKILPTTVISFLNPLERGLTDTTLINSSQNFRTTLFYNRGNSKYSMDYTFINGSSKVLLTNGFDSRSTLDNILNTRINLGRKFTLNTRIVFGERLYLSEFFNDRSYNYSYYEVEPKLQMLLKNTYRFELKTKYFNAENLAEYGGETSRNIEVGGEFKYTKATKGTMNIGLSYIRVNYEGSTSSTLGYELLRGLQNGDNTTWKLGYQRTLSNNIQVVISYDGRQSENASVIHLGRLVARYLF
ncbi:MAG: hypothetical protein COA58_13660 [Bacteroidetes bacterium]|nr:MAG: hypothetical protein COA58_13660 [Bacteroidota bacterium]